LDSTTVCGILKQLSPLEVKLLDGLFDAATEKFNKRSASLDASSDEQRQLRIELSPDRMASISLGQKYGLLLIYVNTGLSAYEYTQLRARPGSQIYPSVQRELSDVMTAQDGLLGQRLIELRTTVEIDPASKVIEMRGKQELDIELTSDDELYMTALGFAFVKACRPPTDSIGGRVLKNPETISISAEQATGFEGLFR
jgi:hypothetical protein